MSCFVALGGNIGPVEKTLLKASRRIASLGQDFQLSKFYWTKPVSSIAQPRFLNACCRFSCTLSPFELLLELQKIERDLGKVEKPREAPRAIDLDILFYGNRVIYSKELIIPHPRWHERLFVMRPLADIATTLPFEIDVQQLLERLDDHRLWTVCD